MADQTYISTPFRNLYFAEVKRKDRVFILLVISIGMALLCAFITYWGTLEKRDSVTMVIQTYQVIESAERVLSLLKEMESGHHGYMITRDSSFLNPLLEAQDQLTTETSKLQSLVIDKTQKKVLENRIMPALENRKKASVSSVHTLITKDADSTDSWIASKTSKAYMDTISLLVNNFIQNERVLLASREDSLEENIIIEDFIQFSSFAVIAITCTLAFLRLVKERKNISALLEKLEHANESLEQKVLARTQQLTEANRAKDNFLAIASHDLKVPLAGVLSLIDVMRLDNQYTSSQHHEYLGYMEESCKGMQNLIANLLDINRIDRGETLFTRQRIDLFPFLSQLEQRFANYARKKEVPLHINKLNTTIETDSDNLSRILENLLSNAIKFSQHGQSVTVQTSMQDHHISFAVIDHGPGIPENEMPLLFKKFARLTNRPTGGESSSGLGLAIVKELTEMAGGELAVASEPGKGTIFTVILPIA